MVEAAQQIVEITLWQPRYRGGGEPASADTGPQQSLHKLHVAKGAVAGDFLEQPGQTFVIDGIVQGIAFSAVQARIESHGALVPEWAGLQAPDFPAPLQHQSIKTGVPGKHM